MVASTNGYIKRKVVKYAIAPGARFPRGFSVKAAGQRITYLTERHGHLKPRHLVEDAKRRDSPFRPGGPCGSYFMWNNRHAGDAYRIEQAKYLLRHIRVFVKIHGRKRPILSRVVVSLRDDPVGDVSSRSYRSLARVLSNAELTQQLLNDAYQDFLAWQNRYQELRQLSLIFRAAKRVFGKIRRRRLVHAKN